MIISAASWVLLVALVVVTGLKLALYAAERWPIRLNAEEPRGDNRQPVP
jgi:hypothetical protein